MNANIFPGKANAVVTVTSTVVHDKDKNKMKKNERESLDDFTKPHEDVVVVDEIDLDLDRKIASIEEDYVLKEDPLSCSPGYCDEDHNISQLDFERKMASAATTTEEIRVFVATWNVGGKIPHDDLNLEDFLQDEGSSDIYVLGFQEVVPLSAGNILVIEDTEPAAKWLELINKALNKPNNNLNGHEDSKNSCVNYTKLFNIHHNNLKGSNNNNRPHNHHFFQKPSLKVLSKTLRADSSLLKSCNCPKYFPSRERPRRLKKLTDSDITSSPRYGSYVDELFTVPKIPLSNNSSKEKSYRLVASKQMVGIFLSVWVRSDLVPHVAHLRVSSVGRGIMGCLGNKGCISISMSLHQTSFCFVCSHLASGEKEGDEMKRNADVSEILKSSHFPNICNTTTLNRCDPHTITAHDRVIWFGDLNYRVALSYEEAKVLLEENDWDTLLEKDQLNIERKEKRVFEDFEEGRILFAPTYKYSHNSDCYAGETVKSKKKRRTPAWCDRILWHGIGIEQLSYIRGESRLSDHRPVCSVFSIQVESLVNTNDVTFIKGFSCFRRRLNFDDCIPQRHSFGE